MAAKGFWKEGWIAVRQTLYYDTKKSPRDAPDLFSRLSAIEKILRPVDIIQKVRSIVFTHSVSGIDLEDFGGDDGDIETAHERINDLAKELGKAVAADEKCFNELLPEMISEKGQLWIFGHGLAEGTADPETIYARLPAPEIEDAVMKSIEGALSSRQKLVEILALNVNDNRNALNHAVKNYSLISPGVLLKTAVSRIIIDQEKLTIRIKPSSLRSLLCEQLQIKLPKDSIDEFYDLEIPFQAQRSYRGAVVIRPDNKTHDPIFDRHPQELKNLVRGVIWRGEHFKGLSLRHIAEREGLNETYVGRLINDSFSTLQS